MIHKLLRSPRRAASKAAPSPGEGVRIYAIGDIHGCLDELERVLARIAQDDAGRGRAETMLIVMGDVIDRGPRSAEVIDRLIALAEERPSTRFLKGNHEEVFLQALEGREEALRFFCRIGGRETILSYGIAQADYERLDYPELAARMETLVPAAHRAFLAGFEDMVIAGDYAFVHAGIRPDVPLDEQKESDLRWIRTSFINHRGAHPKVIVHGHTIAAEVDIQGHRIGVDTGAYTGGPLSALGLDGGERWVLHS